MVSTLNPHNVTNRIHKGQVKFSASLTGSILSVRVSDMKSIKAKSSISIKVSLVPGGAVVEKSGVPLNQHESFALEISEQDKYRRLVISIWNNDTSKSTGEFIGCFSFGVKKLLIRKRICGLYYLLPWQLGKNKHQRIIRGKDSNEVTICEDKTSLGSKNSLLNIHRDQQQSQTPGKINSNVLKTSSKGNIRPLQPSQSQASTWCHLVAKSRTSLPVLLEDKENDVSGAYENAVCCMVNDKDVETAIADLLHFEEKFVRTMQRGFHKFSRPLLANVLTTAQHRTIFQNMEKLVALSQYHINQIRKLQCIAITKVVEIYSSKLNFLYEAYSTYCEGLPAAEKMLQELDQDNARYAAFIKNTESDRKCLSKLVHKPIQHLHCVLNQLQKTALCLPKVNPTISQIQYIINGLQRIYISDPFLSSIVKHSSAYKRQSSSCTLSTSISSVSVSSVTSLVDPEVLDIQNKLLFKQPAKVFQVAVPSRHVVYASDLLLLQGSQWTKVWAVAFNDLLLLTRSEHPDELTVVDGPIYFANVAATDFDSHITEFTLKMAPAATEQNTLRLKSNTLEQKFVWKSMLEQRIALSKDSPYQQIIV